MPLVYEVVINKKYYDIGDEDGVIVGRNTLTDVLVKGLNKPTEENLGKIRNIMFLCLNTSNYTESIICNDIHSVNDYNKYIEIAEFILIMNQDTIQKRIYSALKVLWD
jgi:hypothetical protein